MVLRSAVTLVLPLVLALNAGTPGADGAQDKGAYCTAYKAIDLTPTTEVCAKFGFQNRGNGPCDGNAASKTRVRQVDVQRAQELSQTDKISMMITNVFESGSKNIDYAGWYDLGDNRGYTVGRAGFTTSDGDALSVVVAYDGLLNGKANPLAPFKPELQRLSALGTCGGGGDTSGLKGFVNAWVNTACTEHNFLLAQDAVVMSKYYSKAMSWAQNKGVQTALGKAIFYDTIIQHGEGFGLPFVSINRIASMTNGGQGVGAEGEADYLKKWLEVRGHMLCCFPDNVWPQSASRIRELYDLLLAGNMELTPPISLPLFGSDVINGNEDLHYIPPEKCVLRGP